MLSPLTLERFRICEFYAELLHCSNMSLLNRTDRSAALYDASGHLARGFDAADELAAALAAPGQSSGDDELDLPRGLQSPEIVVPSDFSTSPNDHSFGPYSGMSTPSGRESLDEESGGVLTKAEAKELKAIIAAAGKIEEEEEGRSRDAAAGEEVDEATTPRAATSDAAKRDSRTSNGSSLRDEHDLPPTPSVYSVASRQLPAVPLPPGPLLKSKFLEHGVIPTMLVRPFPSITLPLARDSSLTVTARRASSSSTRGTTSCTTSSLTSFSRSSTAASTARSTDSSPSRSSPTASCASASSRVRRRTTSRRELLVFARPPAT